jgi:HSP20 family molecular chaperone IbpA
MIDEDPFSSIFEQFFSSGRTKAQRSYDNFNNPLNIVEEPKKKFITFDLSGKKVKSVKIVDELEINDYGEKLHTGEKLLEIKFENEESRKYNLPELKAKNKISHTFSNGILEVKLER